MLSLATRTLQRTSTTASSSLRGLVVKSARPFHSTPRWAVQYNKANLETFNEAISSKDRIVLVDFYADWCGPCHQLSPILESLAGDAETKSGSGLPIDLVKLDTDGEVGQSLGQQFKVRALPTVIAFRDGKPVNQFVGALNEPGVRNFLQNL
ncbi:thioredoxin-like protein [Collybia nuda]|uniref:Thioredoxin-like protein n=1 Tax=Collybia nuda TaxID=64659 RepID=A0A9P6CJZ3_9AGAR|nr:thioredoxin-like protein [Collybia nuda]